MKGLHLWITLVATVPLLTGCNETESIETDGAPLSFSTSVEAQTRAGDLTTSNLTSMGVFAFFTQGGGFDASPAPTPNFMYNQEVTKAVGNGPWTYSPGKYWPVNSNDKVSFFAYAPHNAQGVTPSLATKTGYPELTYIVPTTESSQTDLLAAAPIMNKNGGAVNFTLKHALTKVTFIVKNGDSDNTPKTVNSFSMKTKTSGKLTYTNSAFTWGNTTGTATFYPTNANITVPTTLNGTVNIATFYLIPDNAGASFSIKYTMKGNIETGGTAPVHEVTVTDKAIGTPPAWNAGGAVTYTITLSKTGLEVEATGGTWTEGTSSEVQVFAPNELKIGDYYYNDGSWSDGGVRGLNKITGELTTADPIPNPVLTNPETSTPRTCIGVVFYTGKHSTDDSTYPAGMSDVKGYVVSLTDCGTKGNANSNWTKDYQGLYVVGTSTNTADYKGYDNTQKIKTVAQSKGHWGSKFPLQMAVVETYTPSAPSAKSSGWYMPSAGQLNDIHKYKNFLRTIMAKAGSYTMGAGDSYSYWSSTEHGVNTSYRLDDFNNDSASIGTGNKLTSHPTRPVLTF